MNLSGTTIGELAGTMSALTLRAVAEYAPVVQKILRSRSTDIRDIESTLDGLLDFAFNPAALLLYRGLCRHYFGIDPAATARYVEAYREMWDSEPQS